MKKNIEFKTKLIGRSEIFKLLALGHLTQLPVLLIGPPGVGKTQCLVEYANNCFDNINYQKYIVELSYGTKPSEIKGFLNLKKYLENKEWETESPITNADLIIINEVDKGSSDIRNMLLSIMREKMLFLGHEIKKCNWQLFAGSCNEIPEDEVGDPFWDRFIIKINLSRINLFQMKSIWNYEEEDIILSIDSDKIGDIKPNWIFLEKYSLLAHSMLSDRTLTLLPILFKGIKSIWGENDVNTILKLCEILTPMKINELVNIIADKRYINIKNILNNAKFSTDNRYVIQALSEACEIIDTLEFEGFDIDLISELRNEFEKIYENIKSKIE